MNSPNFPTYDSATASVSWLHLLYGYGGPISNKQELLLAPHSGLPDSLRALLTEDLGRLQGSGPFVLTFANVSRRAPGRHCLGVYVASRFALATDEVGRSNSAFKHAVVACECQLDVQGLQQTAQALLSSIVSSDPAAGVLSPGHEAYHQYLQQQQAGESQLAAAGEALVPYVRMLDLGAALAPQAQEPQGTPTSSPKRICYVTYPKGTERSVLIEWAARVSLALFLPSHRPRGVAPIAWTAVEIGANYPADTQDGITVRFVGNDELPAEAADHALSLGQLMRSREEDGLGREIFEWLQRGGRREAGARLRPAVPTPIHDGKVSGPVRDTNPVPSPSDTDRSKPTTDISRTAVRGTDHMTRPMTTLATYDRLVDMSEQLSAIYAQQPLLQADLQARKRRLRVSTVLRTVRDALSVTSSLSVLGAACLVVFSPDTISHWVALRFALQDLSGPAQVQCAAAAARAAAVPPPAKPLVIETSPSVASSSKSERASSERSLRGGGGSGSAERGSDKSRHGERGSEKSSKSSSAGGEGRAGSASPPPVSLGSSVATAAVVPAAASPPTKAEPEPPVGSSAGAPHPAQAKATTPDSPSLNRTLGGK